MYILAVIHGAKVRSGVFGEVAAARGHKLEEWSLAWGTPPPRPIDDYGAVLIFGGAMHADQDDHHPWLREEDLFLQRLLASFEDWWRASVSTLTAAGNFSRDSKRCPQSAIRTRH